VNTIFGFWLTESNSRIKPHFKKGPVLNPISKGPGESRAGDEGLA